MKRQALAAATAVVCLALLAAPAQAGWRIDRAVAIANTVWHSPCDGNGRLEWAPLPRGQLGVAHVEECRVVLTAEWSMDWPTFCTTVLHEWGHLAGFRDPANADDPVHSSRFASVMSSDRTANFARGDLGRTVTVAPTDRRCRDRGRPYLGRQKTPTS